MRAALLALLVVAGTLAALPATAVGSTAGAPTVGPGAGAAVPGAGPTPPAVEAGGSEPPTAQDAQPAPSAAQVAEPAPSAAQAREPSPPSAQDANPAPPDPETDVIGWENGVWHNESIPVDQTGLGDKGLTERETELLVARTMARVEVLRQLEFTGDVTVEYISRETLRERLRDTSFGETTNDQVYEALFMFGEDVDANEKLEGFLGDAVIGYAAEEGATNLTIVTRSEDLHAVDEAVLAHELVHVLQHQQFDLSRARYQRETLDGEWGKDGLIEGEASYIDWRYSQECISNWSCTRPPSGWSGASVPGGVRGYSLLASQPYNDGASFVSEAYEAGGWEAINAMHRDPPVTAEQIIHRDRSLAPIALEAPDRSSDEWEAYHTNTVGEAGMFAMFYAHRTRVSDGKEVLDRDPFDRQYDWDTLDFDFEPTAGWGNDVFRAYRDGERRAYAWTSVWDSERDAKEFAGAYEQALTGLGAWRYGEHTYIIEEGPFADAYSVVRENETVRIVNAPTVAALAEIDSRARPEPNPYVDDLRERIQEQNRTIAALRERLAAQNETIAELESQVDGGTGVETPSSPALLVVAIAAVALLLAGRRARE